MSDMTTTYKYDERKKELVVTRKHELTNPANTKEVVGSRDVKDYFTGTGIKSMMKELQSQKSSYSKQAKTIQEQVEALGDVEVDHEFLEKLEAVQKMQQKKKHMENLVNADNAIKELNKQINDVKAAVGTRIKW